jgi:hypothetical protein
MPRQKNPYEFLNRDCAFWLAPTPPVALRCRATNKDATFGVALVEAAQCKM